MSFSHSFFRLYRRQQFIYLTETEQHTTANSFQRSASNTNHKYHSGRIRGGPSAEKNDEDGAPFFFVVAVEFGSHDPVPFSPRSLHHFHAVSNIILMRMCVLTDCYFALHFAPPPLATPLSAFRIITRRATTLFSLMMNVISESGKTRWERRRLNLKPNKPTTEKGENELV